MRKRKVFSFKRNTSVMLACLMAIETMPFTAFAAVDGTVQDGTYESTRTVLRTAEDDEEENEWDEYDISVNLQVADGKFSSITVTPGTGYVEADNRSYFEKAYSKSKGFATLLTGQDATTENVESWDVVSNATRTSQAIKDAALEALDSAENVDEEQYVLMNIPYDKFYEAEVNNDTKADAVTSATLNKTRTGTLAGGSYHVSSQGEDITGVIFPVKVDSGVDLSAYTKVTDEDSVDITVTNKGQTTTTTYSGKDALFQNPSYAYYALSEAPAYYKEATVAEDGSLSFGKTAGEVQTLSGVTASFSTNTSYGDYQLDLDGLNFDTSKISGVVISTAQGNDYGLRHLENVWRGTELAWCTGFTDTVHNCPTSSEHYQAMMGQTINKITYYTAEGIYEIPVDDIYVPVKFEGSVTVADAAVGAGSTSVAMEGIPSDFDAEYKVDGLDIQVSDGVMSYEGANKGKYTLTVSDKNKTYADLTASFTLYTTDMPAAYDADAVALYEASGFTKEDLQSYIENISSVAVNGKSYAASGRGAVTIINEDGSVKADAAPFTGDGAYEITVSSVGYLDLSFTYVVGQEVFQYVYAGLDWAEYWASEGVYLAEGSTLTSSSEEADQKGELDKGAFDVVSRATTNHGLHRGSYQCESIIYDTEGNSYEISHWTGKNDAILTDGSGLTFDKGQISLVKDGVTVSATMDHYEVAGIKYVPVAVKAEDYEAFCETYRVTENDGTVAGGFSENVLQAYSKTAQVTAQTNGLKTAVKNEDGSFGFSARTAGHDSGLKDEAQKTAENITVTVKDASGSYGEFLRVDLTGDGYGDLGANLYAVRWTYYGSDETYTTALASYGTKFAADNWMHKSMGIQLGLTESLRCQLPDGTDGTGYWTLTTYAMGYADYTVKFQATEDNIVKDSGDEISTENLEAAVRRAEALNETDYTAESWASMILELEEAKAELEAPHTQAAVDETEAHLLAAMETLIKKEDLAPAKTVITKAQSWGYQAAKITWEQTQGADGYRLYYKDSATAGWKYVTQMGEGTSTSYVHQGLTSGRTYTYYVRAYKNVDGQIIFGSYSEGKSVKPLPKTANITKAQSWGYQAAKITWDRVNGASGYRLYYQDAPGAKWKYVTQISKGSTTSFVHDGLKTGTAYTYYVRAYRNVDGEKIFGAYSAGKRVTPVPRTVSVKSVKAENGTATITWNKVNGASGYRIYCASSKNGPYKYVAQVGSKTASYTQKDLFGGKAYYYKMRAYRNVDGDFVFGAYSVPSSVTLK